MKKHLFILSVFALTISSTMVSCKKDNAGCDNGNLCFNVGGTDISVTAVRKELPNSRFRLYWEEGSGNDYKNIEIDIFGNSVAEYTITDNSGTAGDVGFQYYINDNGTQTNYQGVTGILNLTSVEGDLWTGSFSGTVTDGTSTFDLTDGKFFDIPVE